VAGTLRLPRYLSCPREVRQRVILGVPSPMCTCTSTYLAAVNDGILMTDLEALRSPFLHQPPTTELELASNSADCFPLHFRISRSLASTRPPLNRLDFCGDGRRSRRTDLDRPGRTKPRRSYLQPTRLRHPTHSTDISIPSPRTDFPSPYLAAAPSAASPEPDVLRVPPLPAHRARLPGRNPVVLVRTRGTSTRSETEGRV
jgi:hypothetical protein